ncbi:MAG TPA: valine--tRNA ligase [bacterium]|nr:valine--tRNA ligase [bacterium]HPQ65534.1 valine--tRNA ligase [bacterium]
MPVTDRDWPSRYEAAEVEERIYGEWMEHGCFSPRGEGKPYVIVIPPPNVTGILTMGHVLNNTLQDILIRWQRMKGRRALWIPGTDHAGIATQNVVEKALRSENLDRHGLGREAFVAKVWEWKERYGGTIIRQLKKLGASCDWSRERFTLDDGLSRAVREVFVRLYEQGLIYRGPYLVNWCPRCHTALSDEEVDHVELDGSLWHIRYPLADGEGAITVATTRPETMLGDTAVAVHPADERFRGLVGRTLILPLTGRTIPVIADPAVDPAFGTGAVKVTPAHDPNDFEMGNRHGLEKLVVMDTSGVMNREAGRFAGLSRRECRSRVAAALEEEGFLEKVVPHRHAVGHCYRCATVIEPYLSVQWFVKMKPLAVPALEAVLDGRIEFFPQRWVKVYQHWMENIRDWCISRQLWWGHRIPAWYRGEELYVGREAPEGDGWVQDEDVLDTWFSSWLWPFSTLGWPDATPDLEEFYPTSTLVTAPDIIFFWVARMIVAGLKFRGQVPFGQVYFTGIIRDTEGRKMSKSLGNSPDPLDVIAEYGADALRFTIARLSPVGQDVYYSNEMCELGRNFANKIWNAARFVMTNIEGEPAVDPVPGAPGLGLDERAILDRLERTSAEVDEALERFQFNTAALSLYDFFWHHFCDRYLEAAKHTLSAAPPSAAALTRGTLRRVLTRVMGLLHPFMPFISEEIWEKTGNTKFLANGPWPFSDESFIDPAAAAAAEFKHATVTAARNLKALYDLPANREVEIVAVPDSPEREAILKVEAGSIAALIRHARLRVDSGFVPEGPTPSGLVEGSAVFMPLTGLVDPEQERARFQKKLEKALEELERVRSRLANPRFGERAPVEVRERTAARRDELEDEVGRLREILAGLGG